MKKPWSLAQRLTRWFTGFTLLVVVVITVVSTLAVLGATKREFNALASEEVDELRALFRDRPLTREGMLEEVDSLQDGHLGVRIAWRLWNPDTGAVWGEFGDVQLLPPVGSKPKEPWVRLWEVPFEGFRSPEIHGPLWIGLVVDGRGRLFPLKKYAAIAGGLILASGIAALIVGAFFGRRTASMLERIALRVQLEPEELPDWKGENPPIEIERVAGALALVLKRAKEEQERSSMLIAGVAHELRSPIQNILGETEVALMREREPEEYRALLESQSEEVQDLAREIDNLVTYCAHNTNRASGTREWFDLGEELTLRIPREKERAQRRGVSVELHLEGDLGLTGDREALLLVVRNLVGNAISFSPPKGRVLLTASDQGDAVQIAVDDQGPGVAPENRERIFLPFERGREAPGSRTGFGLGLALSKDAISAHGGKLRVVDSPEGGARFEAWIPRQFGEGAAV
ncbi:MAG: HAMP domain-containing sensor histidine kinase [Planctomycetota bacterium]